MAVEVPLQTLLVSLLDPHPDNANEMNEITFKKLRTNMKRTGKYPALIVRPLNGRYQILDGYHRWLVAKDLGWDKVRCEVWDVDNKESKLYLATLNRLRGTDATQKRAILLSKVAEDFNDIVITDLLPETERALESLLKVVSADTPELEAEMQQGLIEEQLMQAGVDSEQAEQMANLYQPPGTKAVLKFVFTDEEQYNKAVRFFGKKGDPDKLINMLHSYTAEQEAKKDANSKIRLAKT